RRDDLIVVVNVDPAHPASRAPHGAHFLLGEADDHARLRGKQDFALTVGAPGRNDLVALVQGDGEDAAAPRVRELAQLRLLHRALLRGEEYVASGLEVADRDAGGHGLALGQGEHVHDGLALGLAPALGNLVHLEPVHLALVREEEQIRVGGGDEEVLDDILFLRLHAGDALAPALLAAIRLDVRPLDVAGARDRDHHLLVGEEVLDGWSGGLLEDLRAPLVAEVTLQRGELVLDDAHQALLGGEDAFEVGDESQRLLVLLNDLVALELGQALEPHVKDVLGLDLRELELPHQRFLGRFRILRLADEPDDQVDLVPRLAQALEDVGLLLGAREIVLRAPRDHLAAESNELREHLLQRDHLWAQADEG